VMTALDPDFAAPSEWAALYREHGLQVVPAYMPRRDDPAFQWKRPMLAGWTNLQHALTTDDVFEAWYGSKGRFQAHQNMGVITGSCSDNVFVIDLDIHTNQAAHDWWVTQWELNAWGHTLDTWTQKTGGGGIQLFFRAPRDWVSPTNRTPIGVDIRGQGGFAMLPPSLHSSGQHYTWQPGCGPWETDIAKAPQWLLDAVDALVEQHGGNKPEIEEGVQRTPQPATDHDWFGKRVDGREDRMKDIVWHGIMTMRRAGDEPGQPNERNHFEAALMGYLRETRTRLKGVDNVEGLERECRGPSLFLAKWQRAMRKWGTEAFEREAAKPPPKPENKALLISQLANGEGPKTEQIEATPFEYVDPSSIPPREWVYGNHYIRRFLSTTVAPGGIGKSSLAIVELLAIATGRPLLGREPDESCPVWYWNGEDPMDELNRRIMAACLHHKIRAEELRGRFFVNSGRTTPIVIAEKTRDGVTIHRPVIDQIITTMQANNIGVISIDPFVASHRVTENDNMEIERVAKSWSHIAEVCGASTDLTHHVRKTNGAEVTVEDGRGAVALLSAARAARVINRMTPEEAAKAGLDNSAFYFRLEAGKANLAPPDKARWVYMQGVDLHNETETRPSDKVGVATHWDWPDYTAGVTGSDVEECQRRIRGSDRKWREDPQAKDWVGYLIVEVLGGRSEEMTAQQRQQARTVQLMWTQTGALKNYSDFDERRKPKTFVRAGE
jgi:hypothetical protein